MKLLLTGAAGMIAGHLLPRLLADGHGVRLADLTEPARADGSDFLRLDVTDFDACLDAVAGAEMVIHLAAGVHPDTEPVSTFHVCASGTWNMLEASRCAGVRRFVCASSINASGWFYWRISDAARDWPYLPVDEDYPFVAEDAYSVAKYANELSCAAYTRAYGLPTVAFRFASVVPPDQAADHPTWFGSEQVWDEMLWNYVGVSDVVDALARAVALPELSGSHVLQLSAPDTKAASPTLELIERFRPELLDRLRRPLEGRASMLSWVRAHEVLGWTPRWSWTQGHEGRLLEAQAGR